MVPHADKIILWARKHIGVREVPPKSNDGAGLRFMLKETNFEPGDRWCMFFAEAAVRAGFEDAGPLPTWLTHTGSCAIAAHKAEQAGQLSKFHATGAIILFPDKKGIFHHAGIVTAINEVQRTVQSIQGNTNGAKSFNGGEVAEHWNSMAGTRCIIW